MEYQLVIDDYIGDWWLGTDKRSVRERLSKYAGEHVDVKISSLGGSLDDGLDIMQQFLDHGDVTAHLYGFVASAATVIAMGARKIVMGKYALFLVHQCSNYVSEYGQMNATDLQAAIERLERNKEDNEKIDAVLAAMYASRCKNHTQEELLNLLKESKWLTAEEALDWGFVDEVSPTDDDAPELSAALAKKFNAAGLPLTGLETKMEGGGVLRSIVETLRGIKDMLTCKNEPDMCDEDCGQNNVNMDYEFTNVAALLGVEALAITDGSITLTAEEMQVIENRLNELEAQHTADAAKLAERVREIEGLNDQVNNLLNAPAASTVDMACSESEGDGVSSKEMFNSIKDLI
jgi:ATP-dependent protease ClpP protease subunit